MFSFTFKRGSLCLFLARAVGEEGEGGLLQSLKIDVTFGGSLYCCNSILFLISGNS